jgi:hypothetical protein
VTVLIAMVGPLVGVLVGWHLHGRSNRSASTPTALQQQIDYVCEIDQRISSAMATLHDYEKRLLVGAHLSENGSASTKPSSTSSGTNEDSGLGPERSPLREPLDGKTLLNIKREVDEHIRECTSVLTRATAVLEEDTIRHAQELVDALVATRETLEEQEIDGDTSPEAMRPRVAALHESRTRFLNTARGRLGLDSLSEETENQIEDLTEHTFSPTQCPRPYMAAGIRLPQERF